MFFNESYSSRNEALDSFVERLVGVKLMTRFENIVPEFPEFIYEFNSKSALEIERYQLSLSGRDEVDISSLSFEGNLIGNNLHLRVASCPVKNHGVLLACLCHQGIIDEEKAIELTELERPDIKVYQSNIASFYISYRGGVMEDEDEYGIYNLSFIFGYLRSSSNPTLEQQRRIRLWLKEQNKVVQANSRLNFKKTCEGRSINIRNLKIRNYAEESLKFEKI